jgi:hypothetical protein
MEESRSWIMKKLGLLSLVGITSIILAQAQWAAAQGLGGGSGSGGLGGGSLGGLSSSPENQIRTTQAQSVVPGKQNRNLRLSKPTTVSTTTGKPAPAAGKKRGEKVSPTPRPR